MMSMEITWMIYFFDSPYYIINFSAHDDDNQIDLIKPLCLILVIVKEKSFE